jgi:hypothetical protein
MVIKKTKKINRNDPRKFSSKFHSKFSGKLTIPLNNMGKKIDSKTIEFILLTSSLINHILLLKSLNKKNTYIQNEIVNVLKDVRDKSLNIIVPKTTSNDDIIKISSMLINHVTKIIKDLNTKGLGDHKGGFYFRDIEEKGDKPITGKDVSRLLDEIQDLFYNLQYVDEGKFLREVYVLLSLLRGETGDLKQYLTWSIFPQYYQITPPFIRWDTWKKAWNSKKYEDLPDYLLAYQKYNKARDEYLVAKGLKSPTVLQKDLYVGKFNKIANALDQNILRFQQIRMKLQLKKPLQVF